MTAYTHRDAPARWLVVWSGGLEEPIVALFEHEEDADRTFSEWASDCKEGDTIGLYDLTEEARPNYPVLMTNYPRT